MAAAPPPREEPAGPSARVSLVILAIGGLASLFILIGASDPAADSIWVYFAGLVGLLALVFAFGHLLMTLDRPVSALRPLLVLLIGLGLGSTTGFLSVSNRPVMWQFEASRSAMQAAADRVLAGQTVEPGWLGLFDATRVRRANDTSVEVDLGGSPDAPIAFVYSTSTEPALPDATGQLLPLNGGWWLLEPFGEQRLRRVSYVARRRGAWRARHTRRSPGRPVGASRG